MIFISPKRHSGMCTKFGQSWCPYTCAKEQAGAELRSNFQAGLSSLGPTFKLGYDGKQLGYDGKQTEVVFQKHKNKVAKYSGCPWTILTAYVCGFNRCG
jgi:hypothetical protein